MKEYYFKEGCFIEEWHNSEQDESMSVARVRVEAKQQTLLHSLKNTTERYVMLQGEAVVTIDGKSKKVKNKDVVVIAPGQTQKIQNSLDSDLIFLAICTPRFELENYQEEHDPEQEQPYD